MTRTSTFDWYVYRGQVIYTKRTSEVLSFRVDTAISNDGTAVSRAVSA
jgi:hypothetical protein